MRTGYSHLSVKEAGPWSSSKVQDDTATTGQGNPRRPTLSSPAPGCREAGEQEEALARAVPTGTIISVPLQQRPGGPSRVKAGCQRFSWAAWLTGRTVLPQNNAKMAAEEFRPCETLSPWDILTKLFWLSDGPRAYRRFNPGTLEPQPFLMQSCHQNQVGLELPHSCSHRRAW